jgi:ATPase family associated with various cellular activities (AAA)
MTEPSLDMSQWEAANANFIAASLAWLRLLLRRQVAAVEQVDPGLDRPAANRLWRSRRSAPLARASGVSDDEIDTAAAEVAAAEQVAPRPALVELAARLGLSRFERDVLLLCAAIELDPNVAALCAKAHGNEQMRCPTFGLALETLPDPAWEVVSPQGGLRFWKLIEITQRAGDGLIAASLRADERIVNYIKGLNDIDDRLTPLIIRLDSEVAEELPPSQRAMAEKLQIEWNLPSTSAPIVQLVGADDVGKRLVAAHAAARCGLIACRLSTQLLPAQPVELDALARLWERESALLPLAMYLEVDDTDEGAKQPPVSRFLARIGGRIALASRESEPDLGRLSLVLDIEPPTPAERADAWQLALGPEVDAATVDSLAAQFALEASEVREIALVAPDPAEAWRECRARTRPRLDALAQRLEPRVVWDDIVLPDSARSLLAQVADQVAHRTMVYERWGFGDRINRGLGVSVLFAGPSGTGKTMAAEVLAARLALDLYRIDLSAVVSKYIGETEKNLRRLFDAAEGGGSILFFDEADALFGKRSEVRDSLDRYANIEINYLLQRMEQYRGLAILATNMRGALDVAFMRRIRFVINFPFPGVAERKAIWQKSFPAAAPLGELDFDRLAQLPVSGGMIRNIAVNAAFLAAAAGSKITVALVLAAARTEFEKLELPIRDRELAAEAVMPT